MGSLLSSRKGPAAAASAAATTAATPDHSSPLPASASAPPAPESTAKSRQLQVSSFWWVSASAERLQFFLETLPFLPAELAALLDEFASRSAGLVSMGDPTGTVCQYRFTTPEDTCTSAPMQTEADPPGSMYFWKGRGSNRVVDEFAPDALPAYSVWTSTNMAWHISLRNTAGVVCYSLTCWPALRRYQESLDGTVAGETPSPNIHQLGRVDITYTPMYDQRRDQVCVQLVCAESKSQLSLPARHFLHEKAPMYLHVESTDASCRWCVSVQQDTAVLEEVNFSMRPPDCPGYGTSASSLLPAPFV